MGLGSSPRPTISSVKNVFVKSAVRYCGQNKFTVFRKTNKTNKCWLYLQYL